MVTEKESAFQIDANDNVATALCALKPGKTALIGQETGKTCLVTTEIPKGHKLALKDIKQGEDIIKYGVRIGRASEDIKQGAWVHLHNMRSVYDERSSHLDAVTGAPKDIRYE